MAKQSGARNLHGHLNKAVPTTEPVRRVRGQHPGLNAIRVRAIRVREAIQVRGLL